MACEFVQKGGEEKRRVLLMSCRLYLFFTAFPIVFQQTRGWTVGESGLSFLGMGVGLISGVILNPFLSSHFYSRSRSQLQSHLISSGHAHTHPPPEARLPVCCIGAILAPIGLFWFAWTSAPPVHWIVPIIACLPFGLAFLLIFTSMTNYLIDSYELYAASALAAQAVSRCMFGAIFPLFASQMYETLGLQHQNSGRLPFPRLCTHAISIPQIWPLPPA